MAHIVQDDSDAIADGVIHDDVFFEEEVRIAKTDIKKIQEQLKEPSLTAEQFNTLHEHLQKVYERFLLAHDMVEIQGKKAIADLDKQKLTNIKSS